MDTNNDRKINKLFEVQPQGVVLLSKWLSNHGYSYDLLKRYKKSGWLIPIGNGAMVRVGDRVTWEGAVYSLQSQLGMTVHPGGKSALSMLGRAHYLEMARSTITLFGWPQEKLPAWFRQYDWGVSFDYHTTSFLRPDIGLMPFQRGAFSIYVSSPPRALMECLYLASSEQELVECYELMETLNNPQPEHIRDLLKACESVKVKRLFMYMAEKAGHAWARYLDKKAIDFGHGKRSIVANGVYNAAYQITVPRELEADAPSGV